MILRFVRENRYITFLLNLLRIYLGWQWLHAGWGKITGGNFDAAGFINGAIGKMSGEQPAVQSWWGNFLKEAVLPNVEFFNILVPWGEFLVGIGLILGIFTSFSIVMGLLMNFVYMLSGSTSTNPQMVIFALLILMAGMNAGKIGLDRWVMPKLMRWTEKNQESNRSVHSVQ